MTSYLQHQKSYQPQILHQECFYGYNDSYKVSFQSVDVNLDFGIRAFEPPPGPGERLKLAGPDRVKILFVLFFAVRQLRLQSFRLSFSRSGNITQTEGKPDSQT